LDHLIGQAVPRPDLAWRGGRNEIFGGVFKSPHFWTWKTVAKLLDGIELVGEIALFEECTGRRYDRHERRRVRRMFILAGRRAGKDRFFSAISVWRAAATGWGLATSD
jgi:hypothetical protein